MRLTATIALLVASACLGFWDGNVLAAEINPAGKMLLLGYSARAEGLGGCGALLGDAASTLYNPAAATLISDVAGGIYYCPRPHYEPGYAQIVASAAARTEMGCIAAAFLSRDGVEGSDLPAEEAGVLVLSGNPCQRLSLGIALKMLTTRKANFTPLNTPWSDTYKTAFDIGLVYRGFLPQATRGQPPWSSEDLRNLYGRPFPRGFSVGLAFQNLGGSIKYNYSIDPEMLPQLCRLDLLWGAYESRSWDLRVALQLQKLLVARNSDGGYQTASTAFFQAWGGRDQEGGWTSRLGFELGAYSLLSVRLGWSVNHKDHRSFTHWGCGLGPEWLRANFAVVSEPNRDYAWQDGWRLDVTANLSYERARTWLNVKE